MCVFVVCSSVCRRWWRPLVECLHWRGERTSQNKRMNSRGTDRRKKTVAPRRQRIRVFKDGSQRFLKKTFSERMKGETARALGMVGRKRGQLIWHTFKFDKRKIRDLNTIYCMPQRSDATRINSEKLQGKEVICVRVQGRWFGLSVL